MKVWNALNGPMYIGIFCKFQHPNKRKVWNALNWPTYVGNSYKLE